MEALAEYKEAITITTIACTKTEMSGDLCYTNQEIKFKGGPKLMKCNPHELHWPHSKFIIGFSGVANDMVELMDFFRDPESYGTRPPRLANGRVAGLILTEDEDIYRFDHYGRWMKVLDNFHAIGSGSTTALGAMHAGATSREAVIAASKVDPFTGYGAKTLRF